MIPWPCHHEYGYYAVPDYWAGRYNIADISCMEWIQANIKGEVWWVAEPGVLYLAFREEIDFNWFLLRWS